MPLCPECAYRFPRIVNITPRFGPKPCPKCGALLKVDRDSYFRTFFLLSLISNPVSIIGFGQEQSTIPEWLGLTRFQVVTGWWLLCGVAYYLVLYFGGDLIRAQPQPTFYEQFKQALTYQPMFPDARFQWRWLIPIGFFLGLVGLVVGLIFIAHWIAHPSP